MKVLVTPVYVSPFFTASDGFQFKFDCLWKIFAPKAVNSRDSEDTVAPELDEDVLCEAVLHLSQEDRERIEKSLVRKLDTRMSILVLIYILNIVSNPSTHLFVKFMWQAMA